MTELSRYVSTLLCDLFCTSSLPLVGITLSSGVGVPPGVFIRSGIILPRAASGLPCAGPLLSLISFCWWRGTYGNIAMVDSMRLMDRSLGPFTYPWMLRLLPNLFWAWTLFQWLLVVFFRVALRLKFASIPFMQNACGSNPFVLPTLFLQLFLLLQGGLRRLTSCIRG